MKPGGKTEMHGHPAVMVYVVRDGKFRFTALNGESMEAELPDGGTMYLDATEYATENVVASNAHVVLLELK